jgi:hypothetical protein
MTEPKTKYPIESFGPQLMSALKRGGRERITTLRQRMRQLEHPDYMIATRAKVSLFWGSKAVEQGAPAEWRDDDEGTRGALIVIQPRDSEFESILSKAGFPTPPSAVPLSSAHERPPRDDLDDLLDQLAAKPTGVLKP